MTSAANLVVLIRAQNETSTVLKQIRADMQATEARANSLGARLGKVGTITAGILSANVIQSGFRSLVGGLQSSVHAAEESNRVNAQLEAVLQSTGGAAGVTAEQARDLASALQLTTRYSDEQVLAAENMLLTFTRIGKDIFPEVTKTVLDMSTALGQDTKTSAIQLGKALNDPIKGVTALQRVGVSFTQTQKEQIKTLVESGRGLEAQKMILAELSKEFGGSAENLTNWEKMWRRASVAVGEAQEMIGNAVEGGLMAVSEWFNQHEGDIDKWVDRFRPALAFLETEVGTRIGAIVEGWGLLYDAVSSAVDMIDDLAHGRWQSAWDSFKDVVVNTGKAILNSLVSVFGTLPNIVIKGLNAAIDAVRNFELPEINLPKIGNVNPVSGQPFKNIPNIPEIPTTVFKIEDAVKALNDLGESAKSTGTNTARLGGAVDDFGVSAEKAKQATLTLGDVLRGAVAKLGAAAAGLFARPTREQATAQLRIDQTQLALDRLTRSADPLKRGFDILKLSVDASQRAFNLHRMAMTDQMDALADQAQDLDRRIRDAQRAGDVGGGGVGIAAPGVGGGNIGAPGGGIVGLGGGGGALDQLTRQRDRIADQQQDLARKMRDEEKAFQRSQMAKEEELRQRQELIDNITKETQARLDSMRADQSIEDGRRKIMQDTLVLANKTLLTDQQQYDLAVKLIEKTSDFTGKIKDAADAAGTTLVQGFDDAMNAEASLAWTLRNETITAFQTTNGYVRELGEVIKPIITMLRNGPTPPPTSDPYQPAPVPTGMGR